MCGIAGWIEKGSNMADRLKAINQMSQTLDRKFR